MFFSLTCDRSGIAITEGITGVSLRTGAHGYVVVHRAQRSDGARAQTGISAFLVAAGLVHRAFGIHAALGTTVWRRSSVGRQTGARCRATNVSALRVHAAWGRHARVRRGYGIIWQWF